MCYVRLQGISKSCQRHFGTTSNTSALNQSIVGGRPDSVQVDSPLRQSPRVRTNCGTSSDGCIRSLKRASKPRIRVHVHMRSWEPFDESSTISQPPSRSRSVPSRPPPPRSSVFERSLHLRPRRIPLRNNSGLNGFRSGYDFYEA